MTKLRASLFGLLLVLSAASCLDLRDADPCQGFAVATCDKSCESLGRDACLATSRDTCLSGKWSPDEIDACTEALLASEGCVSSAPPAACKVLHARGLVGADCDSGDCAIGLICGTYACTKPCQSDEACSGLASSHGYPAYCGVRGDCTPGCESDEDCASLLHCRARSDGTKICNQVAEDPRRQVVPLGDPCGDNLCDPTTSDACVLGYCSKACSSNDDCAALSSLELSSQCVPIAGKAYCQPGCAAETDCFLRTCTEVATVDGTQAKTCVAERGASLVGDLCLRDDDCADALAVCESGMCAVPCAADEDCPSATATGEPARCIRYPFSGQLCRAGCNGSGARCNARSWCAAISEGNEVCVP